MVSQRLGSVSQRKEKNSSVAKWKKMFLRIWKHEAVILSQICGLFVSIYLRDLFPENYTLGQDDS